MICESCVHFDLGSDYEKGRFFYCDITGERFYSREELSEMFICRYYFSERKYCKLRMNCYSKEYIEEEMLGKKGMRG